MARYKVGDVVMTYDGDVSGYDRRFSNQLVVIKRVEADDEDPCPIYVATMLSTGEVVELYDQEIAEPHGDIS